MGAELRRRSQRQPPEFLVYAHASQWRLSTRVQQLAARREHNLDAVAGTSTRRAHLGLMTDRIDQVPPSLAGLCG